MAARIEVISGPDRGWTYTVVGTEARIGRGAGNQVRLNDPAWPAGVIRVQVRQGGYLVANELPYPVFLDGAPLPPEAVRTLHHGATLQPTGATLLRLEIVDAPTGTVPDDGVITTGKSRPRRLIALRRFFPTVILLAAVGFYLSSEVTLATPANSQVFAAGDTHKKALGKLADNPQFASVKGPLDRTRETLGKAILAESNPRRSSAHQLYRQVRDLLSTLRASFLPGSEELASLDAALSFVKARLHATARR